MAGLGSVGSTPNLFAYLRSASAENSAEAPTTEKESRASGTTPPVPEAMKSTVDAIFAEYGLDANEILGPPPGRGEHGAGGAGSPGDRQPNAGEETAEPCQTLLELLNQMSDEGASPEELSQLLIDALNGLDQTA